jgi:hypothetical protein
MLTFLSITVRKLQPSADVVPSTGQCKGSSFHNVLSFNAMKLIRMRCLLRRILFRHSILDALQDCLAQIAGGPRW